MPIFENKYLNQLLALLVGNYVYVAIVFLFLGLLIGASVHVLRAFTICGSKLSSATRSVAQLSRGVALSLARAGRWIAERPSSNYWARIGVLSLLVALCLHYSASGPSSLFWPLLFMSLISFSVLTYLLVTKGERKTGAIDINPIMLEISYGSRLAVLVFLFFVSAQVWQYRKDAFSLCMFVGSFLALIYGILFKKRL